MSSPLTFIDGAFEVNPMRGLRACRLGIDGLERREMLSVASPTIHSSAKSAARVTAALPYTELTIAGHFSTTEATTVTFAAKGSHSVTVTPSVVTSTAVEVAIPALFNSKTGDPVAVSASVSVAQGGGKAKVALKSLKIAALPETGLPAGDLLGAVSYEASGVTTTAIAHFQQIAAGVPPTAADGGPAEVAALNNAGAAVASGVIADLSAIESVIPAVQAELVALASGEVSPVSLGMYGGQAANLDKSDLGLVDRILAAGLDGATGQALTGTGLIGGLSGVISGDLGAGPAAVIGQALGVVNVLGTATGPAVVSPGALVSGLALGSLTAIVAAAEAESQIIQGALTPGSSLGAADLAMVDEVLDDPTLGLALRSITTNFLPDDEAGEDLLGGVKLAEDLASRIDPNVPGSAGSQFEAFLASR